LKAEESEGGCVRKRVCEKQRHAKRKECTEAERERKKSTIKSFLGAGLPAHSSQDGTVK